MKHVWVNSAKEIAKSMNIQPLPRAGILAVDLKDNYRINLIREIVVEISKQGAVNNIDELAQLLQAHGFYGIFRSAAPA